MLGFIVKRAFNSAVSILGLLVLVFVLTRLTGDPAALFLPLDSSLEARQEFNRLNGFDQPVVSQFFAYLGDLLRLDFGMSLRQNRPAMEVALEAFPRTLQLAFFAILLSFSLALVVGALAAARPGGWFDRLSSFVSLAGASAPDFWVAIVGVLVFSVGLGLLPTSGTGGLAYWILPVAVLTLRPFGLLVQVVRGTMIGVLAQPHVKTAKAKGLSPRSILLRHGLRNSMLPVVTVAGDLAASLVNGAVVVETIFGWPGIGKLMIDSIVQRDFAVVQSTILVTACAIFLLNILIDLLYAALDPRIRY
ncbi:ABC transporter permease [Aureimonas phyllosphaerae]|uniref:Peptide/nickel transport system permease protein n=1 Tax=Aureimonas phyllosphaerae TaxID=1166078 RepID=A0A7W6BSU9_9HYPH|nr:ABC transporter permease [Aureimonas phyllosphaerae]MBB3937384.1 peptide/nickel transport system permease protein [Aureimonas phyllosphaerae]MBB3961391.1 peptide/nickel transport system permease protein [Aureimonas phyllosphaerae]SFF42509.1 peptide/nickel transport system permease protein [Aureimonas phyllosphaerae]